MAQVTLSIGGYSYSVACKDGEEEHLYKLGTVVDAKAKQALANVSSASELRSLLFASLILADELQDAARNQALDAPENGSVAGVTSPNTPQIDTAALEAIAEKLENLASQLENAQQKP
jgi:cell division protein ZapA